MLGAKIDLANAREGLKGCRKAVLINLSARVQLG